ncbi:hypothetical protein PAXRUDRAFT_172745 [Paxillus rubicundulus Ve08.2h10]|uniref:Unplaced genomic scaffold scaffold_3259, whole genome shotgun sequence n=1 Tax=Paxillus rubicundulus Ve08.2h10 TaxID=930991 RepID=A0A0D0CWN0_9AGAM|nr:hypothetical protein PAXRUDRAFT_172745 [Paxillus rubicundulus Ve08.2h10]
MYKAILHRHISADLSISKDMSEEIDHMGKVIDKAHRNKGKSPCRSHPNYDARVYCCRLGKQNFGLQEDFEASMLRSFPPIELSRYILPSDAACGGVIANPFVVTDIKDYVILWFLPGVFTAGRQDAIRKATDYLKSTLSKPKQATGWRTDVRYYTSDANGSVLNVSPAWHAQAHEAKCGRSCLGNTITSALGWTCAGMAS